MSSAEEGIMGGQALAAFILAEAIVPREPRQTAAGRRRRGSWLFARRPKVALDRPTGLEGGRIVTGA
jgi:hypothetical protein